MNHLDPDSDKKQILHELKWCLGCLVYALIALLVTGILPQFGIKLSTYANLFVAMGIVYPIYILATLYKYISRITVSVDIEIRKSE
jgi:uncharacterized membrane protein YhdT